MSEHKRVRVTVPEDSTQITKQAPSSETSVEAQLRRYVNMGLVPSAGRAPRYGDFTGIGDFHECLQRVKEAQDQFMALPPQVRKLAENDPGVFLEMTYGGKREMIDALIAAGMMEQQLPEPVRKVEVVNATEKPTEPVPPPAPKG